jgi:hypothetical protein
MSLNVSPRLLHQSTPWSARVFEEEENSNMVWWNEICRIVQRGFGGEIALMSIVDTSKFGYKLEKVSCLTQQSIQKGPLFDINGRLVFDTDH